MATTKIVCAHCGRNNFKSTRGLTQHQMTPGLCNSKMWRSSEIKSKDNFANEFTHFAAVICTNGRHNVEQIAKSTGLSSETGREQQTSNGNSNFTESSQDIEYDLGRFSPMSAANYSSDEESTDETESQSSVQCVTEIQSNFKSYVAWAHKNVDQFDKNEKDAIDLLRRLRQTKSSLQTYEGIMEWHLRTMGAMHYTQTVSDCDLFISRKKLYTKLRERYMLNPAVSQTGSTVNRPLYWLSTTSRYFQLQSKPSQRQASQALYSHK